MDTSHLSILNCSDPEACFEVFQHLKTPLTEHRRTLILILVSGLSTSCHFANCLNSQNHAR
ncbi:MAG: hypothetical protein KME16_17320 [Scytolyngbya sp. HA4215-MV1]|nr:hypothetical protein [Scytolyngbya sp. HA4215-MV1]